MQIDATFRIPIIEWLKRKTLIRIISEVFGNYKSNDVDYVLEYI